MSSGDAAEEGGIRSRAAVLPLLVVIVSIAVGATAWIGFQRAEQDQRENTGRALETVLATVEEAMFLWADGRMRDVADLAASPTVVAATTALLAADRDRATLLTDPAQTELREHAGPVLARHQDLGIFVIAPDNISRTPRSRA